MRSSWLKTEIGGYAALAAGEHEEAWSLLKISVLADFDNAADAIASVDGMIDQDIQQQAQKQRCYTDCPWNYA